MVKYIWSIGLLGVLAVRGECLSARERYVLKSSSNEQYKPRQIWLWDNKRKRVLWKREVDDAPKVTWSKDHRSLAVECLQNSFHVLVWREGFRLRDFAPIGNYSMGCVWSPDNRRLLIRYGADGDKDLGVGVLYCLELRSWPRYHYFSIGAASKMRWRNARTVVFGDWDYGPPQGMTDQIWRVPSQK